jgi:hypothetical protein
MPLVLSRFPQAQFWVIGQGDLRDELEATARSGGYLNNVRLAGYRRDAADVMNALDMLRRGTGIDRGWRIGDSGPALRSDRTRNRRRTAYAIRESRHGATHGSGRPRPSSRTFQLVAVHCDFGRRLRSRPGLRSSGSALLNCPARARARARISCLVFSITSTVRSGLNTSTNKTGEN